MNQNITELEVNGVKYIRKDLVDGKTLVVDTNGLSLVVVRSAQSGVHYGWMKSKSGDEVILLQARRVWYWKGAASLSQLATEGVSSPRECKFSVRVPEIIVLGVCEIIKVTDSAHKVLDSVTDWKS